MALNLTLLRTTLEEKLGENPSILKELKLNNAAELNQLSNKQLESLLSPKLLGLLSLKREDLEL